MDLRITKRGDRELLVTAKKWSIPYSEMATFAEEFNLSFSCYTLEGGDTVYRFSNGFVNSPEENRQSFENLKKKLEELFV